MQFGCYDDGGGGRRMMMVLEGLLMNESFCFDGWQCWRLPVTLFLGCCCSCGVVCEGGVD